MRDPKEKDLKIFAVKKALADNATALESAKNTAGSDEAIIINLQKRIKKEKELSALRIQGLEKQLQRVIQNAKDNHAFIESLIKNKEVLHTDLKATIHFGEVQCEWCKKYYKTEQGLKRHQTTCDAKPEVKIEKKHEEEVKESKEELLARKAALEKEIADIDKKQKEV